MSMQKALFATGFVIFAISLGIRSNAFAQECASTYLDHNGSQMRADLCGSDLFIYYDNPRPGIRKLGVASGTLLFDGVVSQLNGITFIEGNARVFKAGCGEAEFRVEGGYAQPQGNGPAPIYLAGVAPVRNSSCKVTGQRNETLDFN